MRPRTGWEEGNNDNNSNNGRQMPPLKTIKLKMCLICTDKHLYIIQRGGGGGGGSVSFRLLEQVRLLGFQS